MDLVQLLIALIVIGFILWIIFYVVLPNVPMPPIWRQVIIGLLCVILLIFLIQLLVPMLGSLRIR